jgi:hypothetical protein
MTMWKEREEDYEPGGPVVLEGDLVAGFDLYDPISDALEVIREAFGEDDQTAVARCSADLYGLVLHVGGRRQRELTVWLYFLEAGKILRGDTFASADILELVEILATCPLEQTAY